MCQFLSAIVMRDGSVLCEPLLDSHDQLIKHFKVHERTDQPSEAQNFVRVEFRPLKGEHKNPGSDAPTDEELLDQPDKYTLILDERSAPAWWTEEVVERVVADLRRRVERMIVRTAVPFLLGGCFILAVGAEVEVVGECRVRAVRGGTINAVWGGTINDVRGGTINAVRGGTINDVWGGTINAVWGGTINAVWGGTINAVWGGTLREVGEFADIVRVGANAKILTDRRKPKPAKPAAPSSQCGAEPSTEHAAQSTLS